MTDLQEHSRIFIARARERKAEIMAIIENALKNGRIAHGLVLCDNCDTPASRGLSQELHWTCCAPCVWGEADSFDPEDVIQVDLERNDA